MNKDTQAFELVKTLYKNDAGEPFEMSESQIKIFRAIFEKQYPRLQIETYSRFGKPEIVAMAILTRIATFSERWAIIAPTIPKAKILISYIIKHIFENDYTRRKFSIGSEESEERIRRERSKNKLTFKNSDGIGEVFVLSSEATRKGTDAGDILLGFGCIPQGFKVLTNKGEIEIKKLVEEKETDRVYSYNHQKNKIELRKIIDYQKNLLANRDLIEIDLGDRKIVCTEDHPVWIENKGYIKAKDIKVKDKVWVLD